jgi:hypothetical protein
VLIAALEERDAPRALAQVVACMVVARSLLKV